MANRVEKVTISVPRNVIEITDRIAQRKKTSRSKVVSACLEEFAEKWLSAEMATGYKALAKENLQFAEDSIHSANEILPDWE